MHAVPRSRLLSASLAVVALGAALVAPLATSSSQRADAVTIAGARSLSDKLSVQFQKAAPTHRTISAHVLAYNDFHGNLEAASLNVYGQFAGGAAYLAKAIKDRQHQYGRAHEATVFAGDNIGASPLANGLFHEEPATIVANLDACRLRVGRQPRVRQGMATELKRIQNGGCHADGCTGAPYALANGKSTNATRVRTSSTSRPTSSATTPVTRCSRRMASSGSVLRAAVACASASSARCSKTPRQS